MRCLAVVALLCACLALLACSSGPAPPQPGTPKYFWSAAKTAHHTGDYAVANHNLDALMESKNEFNTRAEAWALALNTGIVHGLAELSDAYDAGVKGNPEHPLALYRRASQSRKLANDAAMRSVEVFRRFIQTQDPQIALAFEYPASPPPPPDLDKTKKGTVISDAEADALQRTMMQRGVIYALSRLAGAPDQPAKVEEMFRAGDVQVPREKFLFGMAQLFTEQAQLYDRKHIADPRRAGMMLVHATNALQDVPEDKQVKELRDKIKRLQKDLPVNVT
jgi:hypothetical protein